MKKIILKIKNLFKRLTRKKKTNLAEDVSNFNTEDVNLKAMNQPLHLTDNEY